MASLHRGAFTVTDMAIVICLVGISTALLLPVLGNLRENARRTDCEKRLHQIGLATTIYQAHFAAYPGYWMPLSKTKPTGTTWTLALTSYLDREDLWNAWKENNIPSTLYWDMMICPSNSPHKNDAHWLSYVVNCGLYNNNKNVADGICFDQLAKPAGPQADGDLLVADGKGESDTLFASENTLGIVASNTDGWLQKTSVGALQYTGFCWQAVKEPNAAQQINGDKANQMPPLEKTVLTDYARPASNHPGGFVALFCDTHVRFMREDMKYSVYQVLMASDPKKADFPAGSAAIGYTLKDGDW